jgi:hypothetical protein
MKLTMVYRLMRSPPGYPPEQAFVGFAFLDSTSDVKVRGKPPIWGASLEELRRQLPVGARRLLIESDGFVEETWDVGEAGHESIEKPLGEQS